ncbi:MAG: alkylhydroperoxidase [Ignavibacteria bacterium]|jgi:alkyl hydroperoxide reductase subunit D|nr:alkylhydroperoxidase [Ignavibacteria bacterium]MCU7503354.1 alkylhydroperoxidase [Ignavibacteria bacterium]MCU7515700.1 alkylhydroperoxidase [Ignavibacteria bacterium]
MSLQETKTDLLKDLKIDEARRFNSLEAMVTGDTRYLRDLRINLKNTLTSSENISLKEAYLLALAVASNEKNEILVCSFTDYAKENGATEGEIAEIHACASMLSINNVLYRFRHFAKEEAYNNMPAGIKMNVMMNPVLGREFFELVSLAVSAVNGCETCVSSHEASVRKLGTSQARVFDAIRLASVVRGLSVAVH